MSDEINSGRDYANLLINMLYEAEQAVEEAERVPVQLFDLWCVEIEEHADKLWESCEAGERESYMFEEEELKALWEKAVTNYTTLSLNSLVDKGLVDVSVSPEGDLLYGLTEDGQDVVKNLNKE